MGNVFSVRSYRFFRFFYWLLKWAFVRTVVNYFHLITLCLAALVFWRPLPAIVLYLLFFLLAITGTATPFPTSFASLLRICLNLMTVAKLKPLSECPSWIAIQNKLQSTSEIDEDEREVEKAA